uniref:Uncharacterized protein n=1 Tax=Moniliophthora roreri TaxID=221103 RepID=A0A0W0G1U8_MONRR
MGITGLWNHFNKASLAKYQSLEEFALEQGFPRHSGNDICTLRIGVDSGCVQEAQCN